VLSEQLAIRLICDYLFPDLEIFTYKTQILNLGPSFIPISYLPCTELLLRVFDTLRAHCCTPKQNYTMSRSESGHFRNELDKEFGFIWSETCKALEDIKALKTRVNLALQRFKPLHDEEKPDFMMTELKVRESSLKSAKTELNLWFQHRHSMDSDAPVLVPASKKKASKPTPSPNPSPRPIDLSAPFVFRIPQGSFPELEDVDVDGPEPTDNGSSGHSRVAKAVRAKLFPELPDCVDSDDSDDYTWQECYMPSRREGIPPEHIFSAGLRGAIDYNNSVRRHIHTCVKGHDCIDHTSRHAFLTWDAAKNDFVLNDAEGALFMVEVLKQRERAHEAFSRGASLREVIEMQDVDDLRPSLALPKSIT
jgi:hypothetical protein